ncbi:MAG: exodeoxyribonuclease VII small subunit [Firmicutes bacterium]|nr:exodeoxyribonuclease VII small subunit [Bacillota bacterium]
MSAKSKSANAMNFEESLAKLENVLQKLERSDCPLEEALSLFQEGMELVRLGRIKLNDVEDKISILLKESEEFIPFRGEGEQA